MPKKLTLKYIKESFEKEDYILLTAEYINAHQKLEYICPKRHRHSIAWGHWQQRKRCPYCDGQGRPTIKFIGSEFTKEGYQFLTKKYINAHQKLHYICPKGHKHDISWNSWRRGQRCPCFVGRPPINIEFIRLEFAKENYKLLIEKYINCKQKLDYICSKGHKHKITWNDWKTGCRCPTCYRENNYGSNHPSWRGGVSFEPYTSEFNSKLKKLILKRDGYQCQNLDCWYTIPEDLTIHHIDHNKGNCDPSNLITLCRSCNSRANKDRERWIKFYLLIMNEKYGYVYEQKIFFG